MHTFKNTETGEIVRLHGVSMKFGSYWTMSDYNHVMGGHAGIGQDSDCPLKYTNRVDWDQDNENIYWSEAVCKCDWREHFKYQGVLKLVHGLNIYLYRFSTDNNVFKLASRVMEISLGIKCEASCHWVRHDKDYDGEWCEI